MCLGGTLEGRNLRPRVGKGLLGAPSQLGGLGERCMVPQRGSVLSPYHRWILKHKLMPRKCVYWPQMSFTYFSIQFGLTVIN